MNDQAGSHSNTETKPWTKLKLSQVAFSAAVIIAGMEDFEGASGRCTNDVPNCKGRYAGPVRPKSINLGRNDLCHCGSKRKFKNCCLEKV